MADSNGNESRVLVLGVGAIGGYIAAGLTRAGVDVTVADQWTAHVEKMKRTGLRITERSGGTYVAPVRAKHLYELQAEQEFDLIVLAVKGYDGEWMAHLGKRHLSPSGTMLVCQNGLPDERAAAVVTKSRTLGCVVLLTGFLQAPGDVARGDAYEVGFLVGELTGRRSRRLEQVVALMNRVAPCDQTTELSAERWGKLTTNCMLNAVSATTGYSAAEVRSNEDLFPLILRLATETISVGRALGKTVGAVMGLDAETFVAASKGDGVAELKKELRRIGRVVGTHRGSMLQDVMRGRRTEIDFLNGEVVRLGQETGVETPVSAGLVRFVNSHAPGTLVADPSHVRSLLSLVDGIE